MRTVGHHQNLEHQKKAQGNNDLKMPTSNTNDDKMKEDTKNDTKSGGFL